jgi:LacI family transcriptional regulator
MTIDELARQLGVSKATISYALNNRPGVSPETRARVLELANASGYRLRTRNTTSSRETKRGSIGAVLSPTSSDGSPNYFVTELLVGAEEACGAAGYSVVISSWDGRGVPESLRGSAVAGLLYLGGSFDLRLIERVTLPKVIVGTTSPTWQCDAVLADNQHGAYLATSHLLKLGRRRLCFVNGPSTTFTSDSKLAGFMAALSESGIAASEAVIMDGDFSIESGYRLIRTEFEGSARRINGIFVADDPMALGVLRALQDLGVAVPEEVSVVGFGGSAAGETSRPSLSTIEVFQRELGRIGARFIIGRIAGDDAPQQRILVAPRLVARESSAPARIPAQEQAE